MKPLAQMVAAVLTLTSLLATRPAHAARIAVSDETFVNLDYLLQVQVQSALAGAPDGESPGTDFLVRRSRILLGGDILKNVSFFMETEQANWGKDGDWTAAFYVQDAYLSLRFLDDFVVDAGMLMVPLTHHGFQSAVSLNGLDYHAALIKYPDGSHKVWRDVGVQLRVYLLDSALHLRAGVFNGSENQPLQFVLDAAGAPTRTPLLDESGALVAASNPRDLPRVAGHVRYNLLGTETEFFYRGIHFASAPVVSVGVGADYQPYATLKVPAVRSGAVVTTAAELDSALAIAADVFADLPLIADSELVMQATVLRYWQGPLAAASGVGGFAELGYRWRAIEPVLGLDYFNSDLENKDLAMGHLGFNYWLRGHAANLKLDAAAGKTGDLVSAEWTGSLTVQGQIFF